MNTDSQKSSAKAIAKLYFETRYPINFPPEYKEEDENLITDYDKFLDTIVHKIRSLNNRYIFNNATDSNINNTNKMVTIEEFDSKCEHSFLQYFIKNHSQVIEYMSEDTQAKLKARFKHLDNVKQMNKLFDKCNTLKAMYDKCGVGLTDYVSNTLSDCKYDKYYKKLTETIQQLDVLIKEEQKLIRNRDKYISKHNSKDNKKPPA